MSEVKREPLKREAFESYLQLLEKTALKMLDEGALSLPLLLPESVNRFDDAMNHLLEAPSGARMQAAARAGLIMSIVTAHWAAVATVTVHSSSDIEIALEWAQAMSR